MKWLALSVLAICSLALVAGARQVQMGSKAPDFPPGVFSDGGQYSVSDFEGKVLVLFFYEKDCPTCRKSIPDRNAVVEKYKDKPVKFIAIGAGDTLQQCISYVSSTHLEMPSFADNLSVMQERYNTGKISLQNIYQFRIIGADGAIVGANMTAEDIDAALKDAKWRYKDQGFDPHLANAVELFEYKQWEAGMKLLRPQLRASNKPLAESAQKLFGLIKEEGRKWKEEADKLVEDGKPALAYPIYVRIAAVFVGDDLAKEVADPIKKLKLDKQVKAELEAQRMYAQFAAGVSRARPGDAGEVAAFGQSIVQKFPGTPTAEKVETYIKDLSAAPLAE